MSRTQGCLPLCGLGIWATPGVVDLRKLLGYMATVQSRHERATCGLICFLPGWELVFHWLEESSSVCPLQNIDSCPSPSLSGL